MNTTVTAAGGPHLRAVGRHVLLLLLTLLVLLAATPAGATTPPAPSTIDRSAVGDLTLTPPPGDDPVDPGPADDDEPPADDEPPVEDDGTADDPSEPGPDEPANSQDGPGGFIPPKSKPKFTLTAQCIPKPGFLYAAKWPSAPAGSTYIMQWREAGGPVAALAGKSGFVPSGEGDFQARVLVVHMGNLVHAFGWTDVSVDCPDPEVTIDVTPHCDPEPGLAYEIAVQDPPGGNLAYKAQWRQPGGAVQTVDGQSGTIATGEGTFEIRGVLHYQGPGFYPTDWATVVVDCPHDPGDEPGGDEPEDAPVPGLPTFTG